MTIKTNARLAGATFLLYIVTGIASMVLYGRALAGAAGTAEKLASIARHATTVRVTILLTLLTFVYAVVLAVTIYALTRDEDPDLAMLAMVCRVSEGAIGAISCVRSLALLSIATAVTGMAAPEAAAANALGALLLRMGGWMGTIGGTCFAVGSTIYCILFLRARSIPAPLAWLGVVASLLVAALLPAQLTGFVDAPLTTYMWVPMLVFEVALALWLLAKGVAVRTPRPA